MELFETPTLEPRRLSGYLGEHLNPGEKGLVACVEGYYEDWYKKYKYLIHHVQLSIYELKKTAHAVNVDFFGDPDELSAAGILNDGPRTYFISPLDEYDKHSDQYENCVAMVAVCRDKETGRNISFLIHQDAYDSLPGKKHYASFIRDLHLRFAEMTERAIPGTVDIVLGGGLYYPTCGDLTVYATQYPMAIEMSREEVAQAFGFYPAVLTGPKKVNYGSDAIAVETATRHVYLSRPVLDDGTGDSYASEELETQKEKWK